MFRNVCWLFLLLFLSTAELLAQDLEFDHVGSGRAIRFDGIDDYVNLGNVYDDLQFPFTVSCWIKMDPSNVVGPLFVTQDNTPMYNGFWLVISQAAIVFEFGDGLGENHPSYRKGITFLVSRMNDRWVHICGVMRSKSNMDLYLNGILQPAESSGQSAGTMSSNFPADDARMGRWTSNGVTQFFKGEMDDVRLFSKALSQSEIRATMCRRLNGTEGNLIGYWDFDELGGNLVKDASSRKYDGTIFGNAQRVFSGAPIGDESISDYSGTATSFAWEDMQVKNIDADAKGIQIYKINSLPSQRGGLDESLVGPPYYGVFLANFQDTRHFSLEESCYADRPDNASPVWQASEPNRFDNRREFIVTPSQNIAFDLGPDRVVCPGSYVLQSGLDPAGKFFEWSTGATTNEITVTEAGTYSLIVHGGCQIFQDEITISFLPAENIEVELGSEITVCGAESAIVDTRLSEAPERTFSWNTGEDGPSISVRNSGMYSVRVEQGCSMVKDSVWVWLLPNDPVAVDLGPDRKICPGEKMELEVPELPRASYQWSSGEETRKVSVGEGLHSVVISNGCITAEDAMVVFVLDERESRSRFIPNVMTPNGDPKNEFFTVEKMLERPLGLEIYNRWGRKMYESRDYQNTWNGEGLPDGVYFYTLFDECGKGIKGTISIAR